MVDQSQYCVSLSTLTNKTDTLCTWVNTALCWALSCPWHKVSFIDLSCYWLKNIGQHCGNTIETTLYALRVTRIKPVWCSVWTCKHLGPLRQGAEHESCESSCNLPYSHARLGPAMSKSWVDLEEHRYVSTVQCTSSRGNSSYNLTGMTTSAG